MSSTKSTTEKRINLNRKPKVAQLGELLRQCDDYSGHHVLWVRKNGDVELSRITEEIGPDAFQQQNPEVQVLCETFLAGNEYVGPEAAEDAAWLEELLAKLLKAWQKSNGTTRVTRIPIS